MPKISVIVPVYNMEKYIGECLDSILRQTISDLEVIIINDGSVDSSLSIIWEYQNRDDRIVVIDKANAGVGAARNDGIKAATGEYLAFMDPDDMYASDDVLLHLYQVAEAEKVSVAGGKTIFLYQDGRIKEEAVKSVGSVTVDAQGLTEYQNYQYDYGYVCYIYRRDLLLDNQVFFPIYSRFQDPPFFVRAMIAAERFYALDEPVYLYRQLPGAAKLTPRKTIDFLYGIMDNLRISKDNGLARLHYITAERLNREGSYMALHNMESPEIKEILHMFIRAAAMVDDEWLKREGYLSSDPYLPEVFDYALSTSNKYEKLRKNAVLRCILGVRSRLDGLVKK